MKNKDLIFVSEENGKILIQKFSFKKVKNILSKVNKKFILFFLQFLDIVDY